MAEKGRDEIELRAVIAAIARDVNAVASEFETEPLQLQDVTIELAFSIESIDISGEKTLINPTSAKLAEMPQHAVSSLKINFSAFNPVEPTQA